MFQLYDYFRSSSSYRVRIALNIKNLDYEIIPIHLMNEGGQQLKAEYKAINPQGLVPTLVDTTQGITLTQSLAIIEYLEEQYPEPALLPGDPLQRAKIRACAQLIACEIQPMNNLRVLKYIKAPLQLSDDVKMQWYHHWITVGFDALEKILKQSYSGAYCFGNQPTLADVCLMPQVYNALRFEFSLDDYPTIQRIHEHCTNQSAFEKALPENQTQALA